jgi:hypothetical protein
MTSLRFFIVHNRHVFCVLLCFFRDGKARDEREEDHHDDFCLYGVNNIFFAMKIVADRNECVGLADASNSIAKLNAEKVGAHFFPTINLRCASHEF